MLDFATASSLLDELDGPVLASVGTESRDPDSNLIAGYGSQCVPLNQIKSSQNLLNQIIVNYS